MYLKSFHEKNYGQFNFSLYFFIFIFGNLPKRQKYVGYILEFYNFDSKLSELKPKEIVGRKN